MDGSNEMCNGYLVRMLLVVGPKAYDSKWYP
jgi:hypothetical protein